MTRRVRGLALTVTAVVSAILAAVFLSSSDVVHEAPRPQDVDGLARWMTRHPADWKAAAAIAEGALDAPRANRVDLWRSAYAHAQMLAPGQGNTTIAFVRGGLYHWYELSAADRRSLLHDAAPLLREPRTFAATHRALWELTHDLAYLRRNAPATEAAVTSLREIALTNGHFDDYRELRTELAQTRLRVFRERRAGLTPPQLLATLPARLTTLDEPLLREVLAELQRRPLDAGNAAAGAANAVEVVRYATAHGLGPLEGLDALIQAPQVDGATRALLAIALGRAADASNVELTSSQGDGPRWAPYFRQRSAFEAARGNAAMATLYRQRAVIADEERGRPDQWSGTCAPSQVCTRATRTFQFGRSDEAVSIAVENIQSDEVPPYVEIFVNDALVAEGAVPQREAFRIAATVPGPALVEIRLANPRTRNRIQRRIRLS